jgi:hypothetical protein
MPADGVSLPPKRDFGMSCWAARRLGYTKHAAKRKGHDWLAHYRPSPSVRFRLYSCHGNDARGRGALGANAAGRSHDWLKFEDPERAGS